MFFFIIEITSFRLIKLTNGMMLLVNYMNLLMDNTFEQVSNVVKDGLIIWILPKNSKHINLFSG